MAEIHLVRETGIEGFEKLLVLKKLLPHAELEPSLVRMFVDEARVAATLQHPNIVQVHDIGKERGEYFFTMEFVYGQDLSHLLRRAALQHKRPTLDQAITIILGLCAGLHYAHEKDGPDGKPLNLVHRDVSPQNVLISYDGGVKLMDFGIAKMANSSQKTRDGTLKGKISYMSPEQATGAPVDRRSDIFSVAILLWELTTFKRLFKAASDFETLRRIVEGNPKLPSSVRPDYPAALERIVMKGLSRKPSERYQTLQDMQLDLEEFAREQRLVISPVSLSRYISELFQERVGAWTKAKAEGKTFVEFLATATLNDESKPITADSWVAPASDPSTAASPDEHGSEDTLGNVDISITMEPERAAPRPEAPPRRSRWGVGALVLVMVAVAGFVAWGAMGLSASEPSASTAPSEQNVSPPSSQPQPPPVQAAPTAGNEAAKPIEQPAAPPATPSDPPPSDTGPDPAAVAEPPSKGPEQATPTPAAKPAKKSVKAAKPKAVKPKPATTEPKKPAKPEQDLDSPFY